VKVRVKFQQIVGAELRITSGAKALLRYTQSAQLGRYFRYGVRKVMKS